MESWVVSDCDELTERIRKSLQQLELSCPAASVLSFAAVRQSVPISAAESDIVFFAVPFITDEDIDLLRQIKSTSKTSLVVVSSVSDNASILKAIRAGAEDFLDAHGNLADEIAGFVSRVVSDRTRREPKARTVSIVPCHVPCDASILAANISAVIAKQRGSCCLLDFQLRGGDLALLLKLTPRHTIYDLINQRQSVDETMFRQALTRHDSGIQLLAGPELFSDLRGIQPHICEEILNRAQASFPFVVVNTEDIQHSEQIHALASSDRIIVTMRLDLMSLHRARLHIDFISRNQVASNQLHVVAMGTGQPGELSLSAVKRVLRVPAIHCVPDDAAANTRSINVGNPIVLEAPRSKASKAITALVSQLVGWNDSDKMAGKQGRLSAAKAAAILAMNTLPFCK